MNDWKRDTNKDLMILMAIAGFAIGLLVGAFLPISVY